MNEYMENEKSVLGKYFWMVINFINLSVGKYETQKKKVQQNYFENRFGIIWLLGKTHNCGKNV